MPNITIPLIAATVFTAGGYGILNAKRHAERIRDSLAAAFMLCAVMAPVAIIAVYAERFPSHPVPASTVQVRAPAVDRPAAANPSVVYWGD